MTTKAELNRAIKQLNRAIQYNKISEEDAEKEFKRLYRADREFQGMNTTSIRIMLRLNLHFEWEPLHMFGIYIDLKKLL
jgi:hypothetical protein